MCERTDIFQRLPAHLEHLADLALDIWWASSAETRTLWKMISPRLWHETEHNPIRLLRSVSRERLDELSSHPVFLAQYDHVLRRYHDYLNDNRISDTHVAYFSAEYGLHASLPIYSGGLGILAGDHVKTASDLGLPLTAVGFLYPYGYFEQHISADGSQQADYRNLDFENTPVQKVCTADGEQLVIRLRLDDEDRDLALAVWKVHVGRCTIYLMDSDIDENSDEDRAITQRLYGGDKIYRLRQEIALGVGGVRLLDALGILPDVWHINEGHAAFVFVERLRLLCKSGMTPADAIARIRSTSVFTTHTPVPAGHDAFDFDHIRKYFRAAIEDIGIPEEQFLAFGAHEESWGEAFNMTTLALNMTSNRNAVSRKHEEVTREMWSGYEPITHITNGVHIPTWLAQQWNELFTSMLDAQWTKRLGDAEFWKTIHAIPDELIWNIRKDLSRELHRILLTLLREQYHGGDAADLIIRGAFLDPTKFTVGFARRFATYKRPTLIFRDPDRLASIINDPLRPVQIIFSGKAHPADTEGQQALKMLWDYARDPQFLGKIIFVENYSMHSAKFLVQGVDLWLNNPRPPMEASGTSGMKAAINGVPNLSVLDGWWIEGFNGHNGWGIEPSASTDVNEQDAHEANAIYRLLEEEIVPLYYKRDITGIPRGWMHIVKESIASTIVRFSSHRMLTEYIAKMYR
jgi:starch phosphorylase